MLLSVENTELLIELYDHIKNVYKFNPKLITYDFALANIQAINIIFKSFEIEIIPCFFHLVQFWWKRASNIGLRKKNLIKKTKSLIFNLKLLLYSNSNYVESLNHLINSYIDVNN